MADHLKRKAGRSIEKLQLRSWPNPRGGPTGLRAPNRPAGLSKAPTAGSGMTRPSPKISRPGARLARRPMAPPLSPAQVQDGQVGVQGSKRRSSFRMAGLHFHDRDLQRQWDAMPWFFAWCKEYRRTSQSKTRNHTRTAGCPRGGDAIRTTLRHTFQKSVPAQGSRRARCNHRRSGQERGET